MRHTWEGGWWETHSAKPHPSLRTLVVGEYTGWTEQTIAPVRRLEVASPIIPLILNFGPSYRLTDGQRIDAYTRDSFVAGVYDTWVAVEGSTHGCAAQVNFTPIGARVLLQRPMHEVFGQSVCVSALFGAAGTQLIDAMGNAVTWAERFALLDQFLCARASRAKLSVCAPEVSWAWQTLAASHGVCTIGHLMQYTGWSAKRLITGFRDAVGVTPKTAARLLRFAAVVEQLDAADAATWSARALDRGYFDQSHLTRDFAEFAGCTPTAYVKTRLAGGGGVASLVG
jgi:AraC-like DNA-binding protein